MGMMDLRSIIEGLLAKGYEGGYWDYIFLTRAPDSSYN